jgi:diacylglycerol kinase (ATP)
MAGGGLLVAENAAIDDGKLDLYLIYPARFWQLLASLTHLKFGLAKPEVLKRLTALTVTLRTDPPRTVDVDGELATETPAKFDVRPKALTVMVPRALSPNHRGPVAAALMPGKLVIWCPCSPGIFRLRELMAINAAGEP